MRITRRGLLGVAAITLTGCTGSPTIQPPFVVPPPSPEQEPWAVATTATVTGLRGLFAIAAPSKWSDGALALLDDHLLRLTALDPFADEPEPHFDAPVVEGPDAALDDEALDAAVEQARQELSEQVATAPGQPERLLVASASCAVASLAVHKLPPKPGGAPRRFADATLEGSLPVALSHIWALIQGLELGLGRLPRDHKLREYADARLPQIREARNRLRDLIDGEPPLQPASLTMPNAMSDASEIKAGWAALELGVLDGYARLTAVDATWLTEMQAQVPRVQSLGGRLPHWPGWAG